MDLFQLIEGLPVPIDIEFRGSKAEYLFTKKSNDDCEDFYNFTVIRWWPESREKIVVFLDFANK